MKGAQGKAIASMNRRGKDEHVG
jgi:transcription elongation factor